MPRSLTFRQQQTDNCQSSPRRVHTDLSALVIESCWDPEVAPGPLPTLFRCCRKSESSACFQESACSLQAELMGPAGKMAEGLPRPSAGGWYSWYHPLCSLPRPTHTPPRALGKVPGHTPFPCSILSSSAWTNNLPQPSSLIYHHQLAFCFPFSPCLQKYWSTLTVSSKKKNISNLLWYPSLMSQQLLPHLQSWSLLSSLYLSCWSFQPPSPCRFILSLSTLHQPLVLPPHSISNFSFQFECHFLVVLAPPHLNIHLVTTFSELSEDKLCLVRLLFCLHLTPLQEVLPSPKTVPAPSRDFIWAKSHGHCSLLTLFHLSDLSTTKHIFITLFASGSSAFPSTLSGAFWSLPFFCFLWKTHQKDFWCHLFPSISHSSLPTLPYPIPHTGINSKMSSQIPGEDQECISL